MKSVQQDSGWVFDLTGGRLSLDFANTLGGERLTRPVERLNHYADLVSFGRQGGIATPERARRLLEQSARHPKKAALVLGRARALREAIYRIWVAKIRSEPPAESDMDLLNSVLTESLARQHLVKEDDRFSLRWSDDEELGSILWPVAKATADLLTSEEARRVRLCDALSLTGCAWLFLDETRNHSRRWCSMSSCGNRAKARRHYQRTRHGRGPSNHG